jgi:hypothetical protein
MKLKIIETIINNDKIISNLAFCGAAGSYIFSSLKSEGRIGNKQLISKNIFHSDYLKDHEITQENLKKFHQDSIKHFNNLTN